jgi:hypothetical protein
MELPHNLAILHLNICPKEGLVQQSAYYSQQPKQKNSKCHKTWYTQIVHYYSCLQKEENSDTYYKMDKF